jgi:hypothetical protein
MTIKAWCGLIVRDAWRDVPSGVAWWGRSSGAAIAVGPTSAQLVSDVFVASSTGSAWELGLGEVVRVRLSRVHLEVFCTVWSARSSRPVGRHQR